MITTVHMRQVQLKSWTYVSGSVVLNVIYIINYVHDVCHTTAYTNSRATFHMGQIKKKNPPRYSSKVRRMFNDWSQTMSYTS